MDESANRDPVAAMLYRDPAASILFGIALFLIVLNLVAAAVFARLGFAYLGLVEAAMLMTGAFALVGAGFGLWRGIRGGRAAKRRSALSGRL